MKKKAIVLFICGVLVFTAAGCRNSQDAAADEDDAREESVGEAIYVDNDDNDILEEDIVYDVNNLSEEQRNMLGPMDTRYYVDFDTDAVHDWSDPDYLWDSICLLLSNYSYFFIETGSASTSTSYNWLWFTEDIIKECASALFADFDGDIPEIPWNDGRWHLEREGDYYHIGVGDRGEGEGVAICSWVEHPDGSCTVELKGQYDYFEDNGEGQSSGEPICRFELVKNKYTESFVNPLFAYSIESMERLYVNELADVGTYYYYILPDSDIRYYTESELSSYTKNQLRLARNEIYARHGRIFDDEDLQAYFESQPWYNGTIAASDFSDSLLNEYEKANIKTIQAMENGASTWREAYGEYIINLEKEFENSGNHSYSLIYLDNDEIPELYIAGASEAEGDMICTVNSDGNIVECHLGRNYGMRYVEFSGRFFNWYSHFGYNELTFYKLENGEFTIIDAEQCSWNYDEEIPEDEFYEKWGDLIDFGSVVHPWDTLYSADEILSKIYN